MKDWGNLSVEEKTEYLRDALVKWRSKEEPYACFTNKWSTCYYAEMLYYNKFKFPFKSVPSELQHETKEIIRRLDF